MTLAFGFILTHYILYSLGIMALLISEALIPPIVIFSLLFLLILFVSELKGKIPIITGKNFWGFYAGPLALVFGYFAFDLPVFDSICYLVLIILFTRIIFKSEMNDYLFCYILSLTFLIIGAMGAAEFSFAFIFIAFFIVVSWSMILFHLRLEKEDELKLNKLSFKYALTDKDAFQKEKIGVSFFGLTSLIVLGSLVITLVIFFLMPRLGKGYFTLFGKTKQAISGFSNAVELGDIGRIKLNQSMVMRIETYKDNEKIQPGDDIYWRGIALDYYDGKSWYNTFTNKDSVEKIGRNKYKIGNPKIYSEMLKQVIFLEPIGSDVIFSAGNPITVNGPFRWLGIDSNNSLYRSQFPYGRIKLVINSDVSAKGKYLLSPNENHMSMEDRKKYLQLPPPSDQFTEFTNNIIRDGENKYQQASAIESYLKNNFGYTLNQSSPKGASPIDHFLFVNKKGHCEYFASSMALILRTLGIPARIVNGFSRGAWNEVGNYLQVRQSDAHTWVEALVDDNGWIIFDPTPPAPPISGPFFMSMNQYLDAIKMTWYRYIVNFTWQDQQAIAINVRDTGLKMKEKFNVNFSKEWEYFKQGIKNIRYEILALSVVIFLFLLVFGKKIALKARPIMGGKINPREKSSLIYIKMLALLKKKGLEKKDTLTPREFAHQIKNDVGEAWEKIQTITNEYYKVRFGAAKLVKENKLGLYLKDISKLISN